MCVCVCAHVCVRARDEALAIDVWEAEVEVFVLFVVGGGLLFLHRLQGGTC